MKIALGCDHGAYEYKEIIKEMLTKEGHEIMDFGTYDTASCDYPDFAYACAKSVSRGENERGIVICGTGIGVSITANKVKGIRCALCSESVSAKLTREHNDSNMLAMGQRTIGIEVMKDIVHVWLNTPFSGEARHQARIAKIHAIEASE
ncbi:MAG: ribose 5-phosphate isomerase B [Erysipelotrichaceae bacterium]|nr:ribose 5-phosphate isomerase B [Erysipelotrichaceae bacterium]